jgi:hypothetical protein
MSSRKFSVFGFVSLAILCVILYFYFIRVNEIQFDFKHHGYITGDWLINYTNGLVRRGLFGEMAMQTNRLLGISPVEVVLIGKYLAYGILCVSILLLGIVKGVGFIEILFLISPWALMFDLNDPGGSGRKEILLFASFALFSLLQVFSQSPPKSIFKRWDFYYLLIVMVVISFMHEGLIFFFPFFYLPLYLKRGFNKSDFLTFFTPYLASLLVLAVLYVFFKGNKETADAICNSLNPWSVNGSLGCDAIHLLAGKHPKAHIGFIKSFTPLLLLTMIPIYCYGRWIAGLTKHHLLLTMVISLILTVPLYGIAIDWGRWIHISGLLFFITFFSLKGTGTPIRKPSLIAIMLVLCIAVPYTFYWRIPHTVGEHKVFWWWTQDPAGYLEAWRVK